MDKNIATQSTNREFFNALLRDKRVDGHKLSLRGLGTMMGVSHSQLSLAFDGKRRMSMYECCQISEIFGVPMYEIAQALGITVRAVTARRAAIIGHLGGDGTVALVPQGEFPQRVPAPDDLPEGVQAVQARTSGSENDVTDGWVMFFVPTGSAGDSAIGRMCVAKLADGPIVVTNVRRGYLPGTFNLSGWYNKESAGLEWAAPVLNIIT